MVGVSWVSAIALIPGTRAATAAIHRPVIWSLKPNALSQTDDKDKEEHGAHAAAFPRLRAPDPTDLAPALQIQHKMT